MRLSRHGILFALCLAAAACAGLDPMGLDPVGRAAGSDGGSSRLTAVALVRHAERADDDPDDPVLTAEGTARAARLAEVFERCRIDAIIASDKKRTQLTIDPLRRARGLALRIAPEAADVVRAVRALPPGSLAVVAHHSHAIADILRGLGIESAEVDKVDLSTYDNLFLITLHPDIQSRLVPLTYP